MALPGIYLDCVLQSISIFFTAMEKSYIPMFVQLVFIPLHPVLCSFLVTSNGFIGTAIAYNLTILLSLTFLTAYVKFSTNFEIR